VALDDEGVVHVWVYRSIVMEGGGGVRTVGDHRGRVRVGKALLIRGFITREVFKFLKITIIGKL
jgi:hypothetical protein